jgi:hypothetical protein
MEWYLEILSYICKVVVEVEVRCWLGLFIRFVVMVWGVVKM